MMPPLDTGQAALVDLGCALRAAGYSFVTPTPETHRRVNQRPENSEAKSLRDVFGWSRPFHRSIIPSDVFELGLRAQVLTRLSHERWCSLVRFSTLSLPDLPERESLLFVHSAFPTEDNDSVFFGPDSYRFAALVLAEVGYARRLVDVGCGTGVGGLVVADRADELVLADVNPRALRFALVNVALAGTARPRPATISITTSDVLDHIDGTVDVVIANPPYIVDATHRLYRDGGGSWGTELAARIADESLDRMVSGGRLILYTGTPIIGGRNVLAEQLQPILDRRAAVWSWRELDPDVFGEELSGAAYGDVDIERLAVVALTATSR